jgi:Flp pilus assembly protein TadD
MTQTAHAGTSLAALPRIAVVAGLLLAAGCAHQPGSGTASDASARLRPAQPAETEANTSDDPAALATAAAREPANLALQMRYANALARTGQNKAALDVALPAYGRDKSSIGLGLLVGRLYIRLDNAPAAAAVYQEVIGRDANNLEAINGLGIAEVMQKNLPRAEATFRRAVAIAPADAASRNNLGLALTLEHRTDEAIRVLEALWREDNTAPRVRTNLTMAYVAAGSRDKAVALLTPPMEPAEAARTVDAYAQYNSASGVCPVPPSRHWPPRRDEPPDGECGQGPFGGTLSAQDRLPAGSVDTT